MKTALIFAACAAMTIFSGCSKKADDGVTELNMGFFPNVTHAQGVIAYQMSKEGRGWFEERLGDKVKISWTSFNAGPSAMNSIYAGALDVTYVGPNPAINAFIKSGGQEIRILAGAADGGAGLVANPKLGIKSPEGWKGKSIATPQFANTQDVACRAWVIANGMTVNQGAGGDVKVIPTANPEQLALFSRGDIDGAWTVEPWVSRLEREGGGEMFFFEKDAVTTILVSSAGMLRDKPELVEKIKRAHVELTEWINANPEEARKLVLKGIESLTRAKMDPALVESAWRRITFTPKLNRAGIEKFVGDSISCGFIKERMDLSALFPAEPAL